MDGGTTPRQGTKARGATHTTEKNRVHLMNESSEAPGRTILRDGKRYLFFSGYSYLGMSHVPGFKDLIKEGVDRYGVLFPSSRISNTPLDIYAHLEQYLSQLTGREATVTYASGYLACQALGDVLKSYGQILVAPDTHPAIGVAPTVEITAGNHTVIDNRGGTHGAVVADHAAYNGLTAWPAAVLEYVQLSPHDHFIIVMNSANPLTGQIHDFTWLQHLPRHKRFTLCIDDSHGIGWLGEHGEGIASALIHSPQVEYILTYSLAKALHIPGGAISCPLAWAERLRKAAYYTGSTPMAPAFAHTLLHAGPLYEVQRAALMHNLSLMKKLSGAEEKLIPTDIPVFLMGNDRTTDGSRIVQYLEDNGVIVSSFAYPDPMGIRINRLVISSLHKESDLQAVVDLLKKA